MQQTVFKRQFPVLLDAVKAENVQHHEEKTQPIKNIVIEKIQKKIASNLNFKKYRLIFEKKSLQGVLISSLPNQWQSGNAQNWKTGGARFPGRVCRPSLPWSLP